MLFTTVALQWLGHNMDPSEQATAQAQSNKVAPALAHWSSRDSIFKVFKFRNLGKFTYKQMHLIPRKRISSRFDLSSVTNRSTGISKLFFKARCSLKRSSSSLQ